MQRCKRQRAIDEQVDEALAPRFLLFGIVIGHGFCDSIS